jgi:hypothetical protein
MKTSLPLLALATLLLLTPNSNPPRAAVPQAAPAQVPPAQTDRTPVLVELFTSEGCSTCPPADTLLSKLESLQPIDGAQIIALEEHVDYWNHDGWVDSYSSPDWTLRQQAYVDRFKGKSPFTPQMVVDGQSQFVGNNAREAQTAIEEAAHRPKTQISITGTAAEKSDVQRVEIHVANLAGAATQEPADVWIAVTEDGLESAVRAGENAGKDLRHVATLRTLHKVGAAPAKDSSPLVLTQQVKLKSNWKKENLHIVVFVQERKSLHVLGAASARIAS